MISFNLTLFKSDHLEKQLMSHVPYKLYFRLYYDVWYIHIIILLFKCSLWTDNDISWLQHCNNIVGSRQYFEKCHMLLFSNEELLFLFWILDCFFITHPKSQNTAVVSICFWMLLAFYTVPPSLFLFCLLPPSSHLSTWN